MPNGALSIREREEKIDRKQRKDRVAKRQVKLDMADVLGGGAGLAVGATLTRGMDAGPIPVKVNSLAGLVGLYLLFTDGPGVSTGRKALTSFLLGMGAERVFEISEDRLGDLLSGWMGGGDSE